MSRSFSGKKSKKLQRLSGRDCSRKTGEEAENILSPVFRLFLICTDRSAGIQIIISSFFGHQLFMISALDDPSLFKDHDAVAVADR